MLLSQWKRCPDYLWILASVGPHHSYFKLRCHKSECSYNNTSRWWETRMLLITHGAPALIWQQPCCGWFLNYHAPGEAQAELWHHDSERINNRWRNRSQVWFEYSTWKSFFFLMLKLKIATTQWGCVRMAKMAPILLSTTLTDILTTHMETKQRTAAVHMLQVC